MPPLDGAPERRARLASPSFQPWEQAFSGSLADAVSFHSQPVLQGLGTVGPIVEVKRLRPERRGNLPEGAQLKRGRGRI